MYINFNYESKFNCFEKINHINSVLVWGNKSYIEEPFITIVVPTYRRTFLLSKALNSILTQWHTDFFWDILVIDNEPYNKEENETEKLIKKINNKRILYYRNTEHLRPGDNFNRGILLSRGKWVMMLHDDDLLISNAVFRMGRLINAYEKISSKPLGAISAKRVQFSYNNKKDIIYDIDIIGLNNYLTHTIPINYDLYKLTQNTIWFTSHIGGDVPSNGSIYNKHAFINMGGFNEDFGVSSDLMLFYAMEKYYSVYYTVMPMGFYRWGSNTMVKPETTHKIIKNGFDFREYVYSKSKLYNILGIILRKSHYKKFTSDVISDINSIKKKKLSLSDFDDIYDIRPSKIMYFIYTNIVIRGYNFYKKIETKILSKKARRVMENE